MREEYSMYTSAGNRLIANRMNTVRKKLDKIKNEPHNHVWAKEAEIKNAIAKGITGYANMKSNVHTEYDDTAVRETVLDEFEKMYASAMGVGVDRRETNRFISEIWDKVR